MILLQVLSEDSPPAGGKAASAKIALHERCRSFRNRIDERKHAELSGFGLVFQEADRFEIEILAILVSDLYALRYLLLDLFVVDLVPLDDLGRPNHIVKILLLLLRHCFDVLDMFNSTFITMFRVSLIFDDIKPVGLFGSSDHAHSGFVEAFGGAFSGPRRLQRGVELAAGLGLEPATRLGVRRAGICVSHRLFIFLWR